MEQQILITVSYHLATGKGNLNEIVWRLQRIQKPAPQQEILEIRGSHAAGYSLSVCVIANVIFSGVAG